MGIQQWDRLRVKKPTYNILAVFTMLQCMHNTVLLYYHLVHSYLFYFLTKLILLFYLIEVQSFIILFS